MLVDATPNPLKIGLNPYFHGWWCPALSRVGFLSCHLGSPRPGLQLHWTPHDGRRKRPHLSSQPPPPLRVRSRFPPRFIKPTPEKVPRQGLRFCCGMMYKKKEISPV